MKIANPNEPATQSTNLATLPHSGPQGPAVSLHPPVAALPEPWREARVDNDPIRAAARLRAERSGNAFAALTAAKAADMLRRVLPGAAEAIIERDYTVQCECHTMKLRLVRDHAGAALWYDDAFDDHPDAIRRDELEAYGGPVLPTLDDETREAIEALAAAAQNWGSPLERVDETLIEQHDGIPTQVIYDGELHALRIDETLAVALPTAASPSTIGLDHLAAVLTRETSVIAAEDVDLLMNIVRAEASALGTTTICPECSQPLLKGEPAANSQMPSEPQLPSEPVLDAHERP